MSSFWDSFKIASNYFTPFCSGKKLARPKSTKIAVSFEIMILSGLISRWIILGNISWKQNTFGLGMSKKLRDLTWDLSNRKWLLHHFFSLLIRRLRGFHKSFSDTWTFRRKKMHWGSSRVFKVRTWGVV